MVEVMKKILPEIFKILDFIKIRQIDEPKLTGNEDQLVKLKKIADNKLIEVNVILSTLKREIESPDKQQLRTVVALIKIIRAVEDKISKSSFNKNSPSDSQGTESPQNSSQPIPQIVEKTNQYQPPVLKTEPQSPPPQTHSPQPKPKVIIVPKPETKPTPKPDPQPQTPQPKPKVIIVPKPETKPSPSTTNPKPMKLPPTSSSSNKLPKSIEPKVVESVSEEKVTVQDPNDWESSLKAILPLTVNNTHQNVEKTKSSDQIQQDVSTKAPVESGSEGIENEVIDLLKSLGLDSIIPVFERENIKTIEILMEVTESDMKDFGISKFGDRKALLKAMKEIKQKQTDDKLNKLRQQKQSLNEEEKQPIIEEPVAEETVAKPKPKPKQLPIPSKPKPEIQEQTEEVTEDVEEEPKPKPKPKQLPVPSKPKIELSPNKTEENVEDTKPKPKPKIPTKPSIDELKPKTKTRNTN